MASTDQTPHRFGGDWTTRKLDVLAQYLNAYATALEGKPAPADPFRKAYIDGFAGTGTRAAPDPLLGEPTEQLSLHEVEPELEPGLLDGSARIALEVEPPFDRYIFIEKSPGRCNELEGLKEQYPDLAGRIRILNGEANATIQEMCAKDWSGHRAVLFLDPYGLQVEWATLEAIAATRAIDLWLLYPLWMGVNRVITRSGDILPAWRRRLDLLLGDSSWYDESYETVHQGNLFGGNDAIVHKVSTDVLGRRFIERLSRIFAGVADHPGVLRNGRGSPIYLLCFAAANERGAKIALRIAGQLLRTLR
ncbi:MAG: three-Cys-motif partner protein TcmP [Gemmatimonadales bacterium]